MINTSIKCEFRSRWDVKKKEKLWCAFHWRLFLCCLHRTKQTNVFIKFVDALLEIGWYPCNLQANTSWIMHLSQFNSWIKTLWWILFSFFYFSSVCFAQWPIGNTMNNGTTPPKWFWFCWSHSNHSIIVVDHRSYNVINNNLLNNHFFPFVSFS